MKKTTCFRIVRFISSRYKYNMAFIRLCCKPGITILTWRHEVMLRTLKINENEAGFTGVMGYGV